MYLSIYSNLQIRPSLLYELGRHLFGIVLLGGPGVEILEDVLRGTRARPICTANCAWLVSVCVFWRSLSWRGINMRNTFILLRLIYWPQIARCYKTLRSRKQVQQAKSRWAPLQHGCTQGVREVFLKKTKKTVFVFSFRGSVNAFCTCVSFSWLGCEIVFLGALHVLVAT